MLFTQSLTLVALLTTSALASPLAQNGGGTAGTTGLRNNCDGSTFVPVTGSAGNAPSKWDCQLLRDGYIAKQNKSWLISGPRIIGTVRTCQFSATVDVSGTAGWIGRDDIMDLMRDSLNLWKDGETTQVQGAMQVGESGDVNCVAGKNGEGKKVPIAWTLGHS
ncbi:unnamed protein product [Zymoseptoria tritici ST99CH_3D1]|nr:unnamed protein product [Zymoseptoria tritici ST99CH_3D1]